MHMAPVPQKAPPVRSPAAIDHYENFPVASLLCPPHLRPPISAIYHFARIADDLADEGSFSAEERLQQLKRFQSALHQTSEASEWAHVFEPLFLAMAQFQLPLGLLNDLLLAFMQDVEKTSTGAGYADETELLDYCSRSANPVGRLLLHLYQVTEETALQESDAICTALQLINFWQDLSVDIPRGRYYLPDAALQRHGVQPSEMRALQQTPNATLLIAECAYSARSMMEKGSSLVHRIPGRAGWELRFMVQGGLRILDKLDSMGYAAFGARPTLRWWDWPVIAWRCIRMRNDGVTIGA